jgi:hypothetical protein
MPVPLDFATRPLRTAYVNADRLIRIFRTPPGAKVDPLYPSRAGTNRFDAPAPAGVGAAYGVTYAAFDLATCFSETVTRERNRQPLVKSGISVSESSDVITRYVARLAAVQRLKMADLTDVWLYSIGAEAGEFNSENYQDTTQLWSIELFGRTEEVDGLLYRSRFLNGRLAVAIFDRAISRVGLTAGRTVRLDKHAAYPRVLTELGICLMP